MKIVVYYSVFLPEEYRNKPEALGDIDIIENMPFSI